ncbi:uncharacterized protein G2W53_021065 [Senna tora]|uniref:Uncharacterized protein n=1 Tax=Senna tora TaxID=362788 RepID=A0A834WKR2_9FABA|nr:uncharacterized protein G2W53_021065 [Senna tora]
MEGSSKDFIPHLDSSLAGSRLFAG